MAQATLVRPNPVLTRGFANAQSTFTSGGTLTVQGTVNKTIALTVLLLVGAGIGWPLTTGGGSAIPFIAAIVALVMGLITTFKPTVARITAPIYALLEGIFIGAISQSLNASYPGVALTAAELSMGILVGLLVLFKTGAVKVTDKFRAVTLAATMAIFLTIMVDLVISLFGGHIGFTAGNSTFAIVFSVIVIGIACANLLVDFDYIQRSAGRAPAYMEWYAAYGVIVTMVWLYIEVLRLLSQLRSR